MGIEKVIKHLPGKHSQQSHAGSRGGGSSGGPEGPSTPAGSKKPIFGQYVEKKIEGEGQTQTVNVGGNEFEIRQGKTWQQLDAKQLWNNTYYDAAQKRGDTWEVLGTIYNSRAGYGDNYWKHDRSSERYPTAAVALDAMRVYRRRS